MISEEVLDSIQILKFLHDKCNSEKSIGMMQVYRVDELAKAIETILNLIEKQSKEIEELKIAFNNCFDECTSLRENFHKQIKINKKLEARKYMLNTTTGEVTAIPLDNNYISKDKIKAKMKEIKDRPVQDEFITASQGKINTIIEMQSLLEKE